MAGTVIVGAQWGDEGKGKIVDRMAAEADLVVRYQGGNNAGHTIVRGSETFSLHLIPSGMLHPGVVCALGNGVVIDAGVLLAEIRKLHEAGIDTTDRLLLSPNAHLITPYHVALDGASENAADVEGSAEIGTTRRGIGPCYADKAARLGIRVQDLFDPATLRARVELSLRVKNLAFEHLYGMEKMDPEAVSEELLAHAPALEPLVADVAARVDQECRRPGSFVLFEGAQGTLLDIDHGTYPYVTSSNPVAAAACVGSGVGPAVVERVVGVAKAYTTRVGRGPFPSEAEEGPAAELQRRGHEFGTTTGRRRRCGWLDLPALRTAVRLNGITELALTKLDVLGGFGEIPVCVEYEVTEHRETTRWSTIPPRQRWFDAARPVLRTMPGWTDEVAQAASWDDLPEAAQSYVKMVEEELGVPVRHIGVGADTQAHIERDA